MKKWLLTSDMCTNIGNVTASSNSQGSTSHFRDLLLKSAGVWWAAGGFAFAALEVAGIPPISGIVINCGIPQAEGVVWIPKSRCNCSRLNIMPLEALPPLYKSDVWAFVLTLAVFTLFVDATENPTAPQDAIKRQKQKKKVTGRCKGDFYSFR